MSIVFNFTAVSHNFKDDHWWTAGRPDPVAAFDAAENLRNTVAALRAEVEQMEREQDILGLRLLADERMKQCP
jgi:hypothetical protein